MAKKKQKLFDVTGSFGDNVFKKRTRYSYDGVYPLTSLFLDRFWREFWVPVKFNKPVIKTYRPKNDIFAF